jgi:sulfatase modifying factor 1
MVAPIHTKKPPGTHTLSQPCVDAFINALYVIQKKEPGDWKRVERDALAEEFPIDLEMKEMRMQRLSTVLGFSLAVFMLVGALPTNAQDAKPKLASENTAPADVAPKQTLDGPLGITFVLIPGGTFNMGAADGNVHVKPVHAVTVSSYYMSRTEVTRAQYEAYDRGLKGAPATTSVGALQPAVNVTWGEATSFCKYLTGIDKSGATYRLPREAEWEFAARGSDGRRYPWGSHSDTAARANLIGDADGHSGLAPVGSYPKGNTPLAIQDLSGNAYEWTADLWGPYSAEAQTDPTGPRTGDLRVIRGGAFLLDASRATGWARGGRGDSNGGAFIGIRVVRELTANEKRSAPVKGQAGGKRRSIRERLQLLKELHDSGLITEELYKERQKAILEEL